MKKKKLAIYITTFTILASSIPFILKKETKEPLQKQIVEYISEFNEDNFEITAHRGFSSLEIENTRESLSLAAKQKYIDYIEVDARMTKDQKIVLSHNNTLLDENNKKKKVSESNYQNILETIFIYQINPFYNVPTTVDDIQLVKLREVSLNKRPYSLIGLIDGLKSCKNKKILLDLKFQNNTIPFVKELKEELKKENTSKIIFQSNNLVALKYLQDHSNYNCLAIIDSGFDYLYLNTFQKFGIKKSMINYNLVKKLLKDEKKVAIWTINNTNDLDKATNTLKELYKEINYITDYPDLIATKLHEKEKIKIHP